MPKIEKTFDKTAYDKKYHKEKYKQLAAVFTKEEAARVERAAASAGVSKSQYIKTATLEKVEREENAETGS